MSKLDSVQKKKPELQTFSLGKVGKWLPSKNETEALSVWMLESFIIRTFQCRFNCRDFEICHKKLHVQRNAEMV
jgi:hypothetical protein